ncbi:MAG: phosphoenolpyruvate--protein phosphotransferase, partial [Candidatus Aureabacteria bacterium]|nr:phosphoenolpyruvate--protein phosphotransferase [Candidatus Auribacterota bacterium]
KEIGFDESNIFQVHMGILEDKSFIGEIQRRIEEDFFNAESAVKTVIEVWERRFSESFSPQVQVRAADVLDVGKRILANLCIDETLCLFRTEIPVETMGKNVIFVTRVLLPSVTAFIDKKKIKGIVAELGNKASHSAVIAKSLGLPAVFGVANALKNIKNGDEVILDGSSGTVFVHPDPEVKNEYETIRKDFSLYQKRLGKLVDEPSVTKEGREIELYANIGALADAETAVKNRAKGVGLYRTEMPFIIRNEFPAEDLQYAIYKKVIEKMEGASVSIRTLDLGGDKILSYLPMPKEENPNLGWRAIRVFIDHPDLFKVQLRAILRASVHGKLKIIIPMISDLSEVRITKKIFAEAKRELTKEGVAFDKKIELGIMIEVPSAVILAEHLIKEVDFFSVGTNDLIQYTLAVDRNSEKVSKYFEPLNPSILLMLKSLLSVARKAGKDITICGEVAGDPLYIPILVGLGYQKLSLNPTAINLVKDLIRGISFKDSERLAALALEKKTAMDVKKLLERFLSRFEKLYRIYCHPLERGRKSKYRFL